MHDRVVALAVVVGMRVVRRLPERLAYRLFALAGDVTYVRRPTGVRRLRANLRRAAPTLDDAGLDRLTREAMRSYLRYWCDTIRIADWDRATIIERIEVVDEQLLRAAYASGTGVVAALAHSGNWDHAGAWTCATGIPVTTVAERLEPEAVYDAFVGLREGLGMTVLPLTGGEGNLLITLKRVLRDGGFVPLLADRDLRANGVAVTLLGEASRMPPGPAVLAMQTGASLLPMTSHYAPGRMVLTMHPPIAVPAAGSTRERVAAMMQEVADVFSAEIAAHPSDWHMLQPVFTADARTPS